MTRHPDEPRFLDDLSDDDFLDLLGPADSAPVRRASPPPSRFTPPKADPATKPLPDADYLADEQHMDAQRRLQRDTSQFVGYPWPSVEALTGKVAPGEILFVLGRTGQGKSAFLQNWFDYMTVEERVPTLYIGTEQAPEILKIKHACLRCGIYPKLVLKPTDAQKASGEHAAAVAAIQPELERVRQLGRDGIALYAACDYINRTELSRWIAGGVKKYGIKRAIVDHIDEVDHGAGTNPRHENTETLNLLQRTGRQHGVAMLIASQCKRAPDRLLMFTPPGLEDLAENNNKERKASYVLGVWRPLRADVSKKELALAKLGQMDEAGLFEPNTMGVKLLKTREDSGELGKSTRLWMHKGRLSEISEKDRLATTRAGIRTREPVR